MPFRLTDQIVGQGRDWQVIQPANTDHEALSAAIGAKIGRTIQGTLMHYVTGGAFDEDGNLWISSYYNKMHRLNEQLQIDYTPDIAYESPDAGDGTAFLQDMSVTKDGSRLLLAVSYGRHCVRVYSQDDGALISTIGVPGQNGNISDGMLWNPHSAVRLANGNIIVSSYNGFGESATNHGTITEWDVSTPAAQLVATRMEFVGDGVSTVGTNKIFRPMRMILDKDDPAVIWISEYGRGKILKVDTSSWVTVDIINPPTEVLDIRNSFGLTQMSDGTMVVASNIRQKIIGINPVTKEQVFEIDPKSYGSSGSQMRGVFEISPGHIAWADWSTQLIYCAQAARFDIAYVPPTVQPGWEVERLNLPDWLDPDDFVARDVRAIDVDQRSAPVLVAIRRVDV